jgi:hypothetical protein
MLYGKVRLLTQSVRPREAPVLSSQSPSGAPISPHPFGAGPLFRDLSVGEASRPKAGHGSLGTEEQPLFLW